MGDNKNLPPIIPISQLPQTEYSDNMWIMVSKEEHGEWKSYRVPLWEIIKKEDPQKEILADPYQKGVSFTGTFKLNTGAHEAKWINDYDYPSGTKSTSTNLIAQLNFQEVDEYYFLKQSIPFDYGGGTNHDPSWLSWLAFSESDVKSWTGKESAKLSYLNHIGGFGFNADEGVTGWQNQNLLSFDTEVTGQLKYNLPTNNDWLQLIGQAPTTSDDIMQRFIDFAFMSAEDNIQSFLNTMTGKGTSGLNLFPMGSKGNGQGMSSYGYGWSCMLACRDGYSRFNILKNAVGGVTGIAFNNGAHALSVRYCLPKTSEQLGYELYIDEANDKILMLSNTERSDLPILEKGLKRGIALRYANREHKVITKSLSDITNESQSILSQIQYV